MSRNTNSYVSSTENSDPKIKFKLRTDLANHLKFYHKPLLLSQASSSVSIEHRPVFDENSRLSSPKSFSGFSVVLRRASYCYWRRPRVERGGGSATATDRGRGSPSQRVMRHERERGLIGQVVQHVGWVWTIGPSHRCDAMSAYWRPLPWSSRFQLQWNGLIYNT